MAGRRYMKHLWTAVLGEGSLAVLTNDATAYSIALCHGNVKLFSWVKDEKGMLEGPGWFLNRWATFIFDGDPNVDKRLKLCGSFGYKKGLARAARLTAHQTLAECLDAMGEQGMPLELALKSVFNGACCPVRCGDA